MVIMDCILKKERMAFYFNQALSNIEELDDVIKEQLQHVGSNRESTKKALDIISENNRVLKTVENYVFNSKDVTKNTKGEIEILLLKLRELRNYYSHYVHTDSVKMLRDNSEKSMLERYYQRAIEATGSETVKLEIINNNKLTEAGVLFLLCMFLKKAQANKLISSISGFKDNRDEKKARRNLFTHYSIREGYKIIPDMYKHFLLFQLVNHLDNQDYYIKGLCQSEEIGKGYFFHRMASTFLNISGIMADMKFYSYESRRLEEQRGELKPEDGRFIWIEPFQRNSYFSMGENRGVVGEEQLKELCYALLIDKKKGDAVEGKIRQFLINFSKADNEQAVNADNVLDRKYFPANYFAKSEAGSPKERILERLEKVIKAYETNGVKAKAYNMMKEVMDFINNSLPADKKLKRENYRRYLNMVRFWGSEKENIKREFENKKLLKCFPSSFWLKSSLEDVYKLAKKANVKIFNKLKHTVTTINEQEFEKYRQINDAENLEGLKLLSRKFNIRWQEKDWIEYSRQIKKQITDRQKLTIMKQRLISSLKKKHGIENLNLRITTDSDKSRQAVLNRIAIPKGFVKKYILHQPSENILKKIREAECRILLHDNYKKLSKYFFDAEDFDKMTQINSLYEKNKLIAFMVVYLINKLKLSIGKQIELSKLGTTKIPFKISNKVTENIPLSKYPSLVYAVGRKYIDKVDTYKFDNNDMPVFDKIDIIEKERMECVEQLLGFEEYLFDNKIIDKKHFADTETHISFGEICTELCEKGWDEDGLEGLKKIRNAALHGKIPENASFRETELLIEDLKKNKV